MNQPPAESPAGPSSWQADACLGGEPSIYAVAFVTGAIVMSFEMLGSRYLNPYFGSGIYTWAALISTVLAALTAGYFLGGWLADRTAVGDGAGADRADRLGLSAGAAELRRSACWNSCSPASTTSATGSLLAALAIMFLPGDLARHVFAVRHPPAAALGAAFRHASRARSTASRPPAGSSARSAPPSS